MLWMSLGNNVTFIGRLTRDIGLKKSGDTTIAFFTLARNNYKGEGEFFDFVAFGKNAEFATKYFSKGNRVGVQGYLSTNIWERGDGTKNKQINIVVENFEFIESSNSSYKNKNENDLDEKPRRKQVEDDDDEDYPF